MSSHSPPSRLRPHVVRHLDISSPSVWQVHECVNSTAELARIISVGLRVNGGTSDSLSHTVYNSMYVYIHSICVCAIKAVRRGEGEMGCWLSVWSDFWICWSVVRKPGYYTAQLISERTLTPASVRGVCRVCVCFIWWSLFLNQLSFHRHPQSFTSSKFLPRFHSVSLAVFPSKASFFIFKLQVDWIIMFVNIFGHFDAKKRKQ